jgi:hypothetical protein
LERRVQGLWLAKVRARDRRPYADLLVNLEVGFVRIVSGG